MIRNTAGQSIGAEMINATTGAAFAGVVTVFVTIDAGVQAIGTVGAGLCTAEGNGYYSYRPSQAETDGALVAFTFTGTGAIPATIQVATLSQAQQVSLGAVGGPTSVTARDLITAALQSIGVYGLEDTVGAGQAMDGLARLNRMVSGWALQSLTIPIVSRTVFPMVTGKGTEANPYTIGPTGDLVMATRPLELEGIGLLMSGPAPQIELQRTVYTDAMWNGIAVKDLASGLFTGGYYAPTVPNGELILWPVPNTTIHSLVIYRAEQLGPFANLSTAYILPDGFQEALEYNLAVRLAPAHGVAVTPEIGRLATMSLANMKRVNLQMIDLENDFAFHGGGYAIELGNG